MAHTGFSRRIAFARWAEQQASTPRGISKKTQTFLTALVISAAGKAKAMDDGRVMICHVCYRAAKKGSSKSQGTERMAASFYNCLPV